MTMRRNAVVTLCVFAVSACSGSATHLRPTASVSCNFGNAAHTSVTLTRTPTSLIMRWRGLPAILDGHRDNGAGVKIGVGLYISLVWHSDGTSSAQLSEFSAAASGAMRTAPHSFGHHMGRVVVSLGRIQKLPKAFVWTASTGIADLGNLVLCPAGGRQLHFP
jgi:hypothetical protein